MKLVKNENEKNSVTKISEEEAEQAFVKIIKYIGEDPSREGLLSTPKRLVKAFKEYFKGYHEDPKKILEKTFGSSKKCFCAKSLRTSYGPHNWSCTCCLYSRRKSSWTK